MRRSACRPRRPPRPGRQVHVVAERRSANVQILDGLHPVLTPRPATVCRARSTLQGTRVVGVRRTRSLALHGPLDRHRRLAQRGQVHPVQRAHRERGAGRELPVRDDRAERRRRRGPRSAAGGARGPLRRAEGGPRLGHLPRHRGHLRGASHGEGLGNQFLAAIRETDAICEVVRAFVDDDVVHVDGRSIPRATSRRSRPS